MTARVTGQTVGEAVETRAEIKAASLVEGPQKATPIVEASTAKVLRNLHENGACAGMALGGIALATFGLPLVPHSLCVVIGVGLYIGGALQCTSDRIGGLMIAGPLLVLGVGVLWMGFVYADAGNVSAAVSSIIAAALLGFSAAWGLTLVIWLRKKDGLNAVTPIEREGRRPATMLAHSRFAGQPHASVADTEI